MDKFLHYIYLFFFVLNSIVLVVDTFEISELVKKEFHNELEIARLKAMLDLIEEKPDVRFAD
jgi:hypothetical protein